MRISPRGIALIKKYEGLRLKAYYCSANVLTIGYGSTGKHVTPGMTISREEAEELLIKDLVRFELGVMKLCPRVNQHQFDALVSFAFNLGLGALQRSSLRMKVNRGEFDNVPAEFMKWVRGGGRILPGLVKRREEEANLFMEG